MSQEDFNETWQHDDEDFGEISTQAKPPSQRPPPFDHLMNSVRFLTRKVDHIHGFNFQFGGGLSNNIHLTGSWSLPNPQIPKKSPFGMPAQAQTGEFQLGVQYLHGVINQFTQPKLIMTGRQDSSGKLEAVILKNLNKNANVRLNAGYLNSDINYAQISADINIEGDDYAHSLKLGNQMNSVSFMQTIGKRLCLGFEMMHLVIIQQKSQRKMFMFNYGGRYKLSPKQNLMFQYMAPNKQLVLAFQHNLNKTTQLVSELEYSLMDGKTRSILAYRQKFQQCSIQVTCNSKCKISSSITLMSVPHQVKLCSQANYLKDTYKFGFGIVFGQV